MLLYNGDGMLKLGCMQRELIRVCNSSDMGTSPRLQRTTMNTTDEETTLGANKLADLGKGMAMGVMLTLLLLLSMNGRARVKRFARLLPRWWCVLVLFVVWALGVEVDVVLAAKACSAKAGRSSPTS